MIRDDYRKRVELLIRLLPSVARVKEFALKGGTAINLFERAMPRLSVDIDLVWTPFTKRPQAMVAIKNALNFVARDIQTSDTRISVRIPRLGESESRIVCYTQDAEVKIEVNEVSRGHVWDTRIMEIHDEVQELMGHNAEIDIVSRAELYGGKICAALDRQHPRDLFDVKILLDSGEWNSDILDGLLVALLSHPRPIHEVLNPRFTEQMNAFENQFVGMTNQAFTYSDFEDTRQRLRELVISGFRSNYVEFLCEFSSCNPRWELFSAPQIAKMPAIQWKLMNLKKLQQIDPTKFRLQRTELERIFSL